MPPGFAIIANHVRQYRRLIKNNQHNELIQCIELNNLSDEILKKIANCYITTNKNPELFAKFCIRKGHYRIFKYLFRKSSLSRLNNMSYINEAYDVGNHSIVQYLLKEVPFDIVPTIVCSGQKGILRCLYRNSENRVEFLKSVAQEAIISGQQEIYHMAKQKIEIILKKM